MEMSRPAGSRFVLFAGVAVAVFGTGAGIRAWRNSRPVELDAEALRAAQVKWNAQGVRNYDIDVEVIVPDPAEIQLQVRRGSISNITFRSYTPDSKRQGDRWTVPGQLEILRQELALSSTPGGLGIPEGVAVERLVRFDSHYGYPVSFHRQSEDGRHESRWRTTRFRPLEN